MKGELDSIPILKDEIFSIITPYDIYRYYVGAFHPNRVMSNPFRVDPSPSFMVGSRAGEWNHFDFANTYWRGDAVDLVQQIHSCSFLEALTIINNDLNLKLRKGSKTKKSNIITWTQPPKEEDVIPPPLLQVVTRKFNKEELSYWNEYHTSEDEIKRGEIYAPHSIYRNRRRLPLGNLLTFVYWYEELQKWKIYRPHGLKKKNGVLPQQYKWDSTVDYKYCDGLKNFSNCKFSYLTKSRKDRIIVSRILGVKCIADVQAEDPHCITQDTINTFKSNSEYQITIFDNDETGKRSSWWLTNEHGFGHANVPDEFLSQGVTDFADVCRIYGDEYVYNYFKNKNLI